MCKYCDIKRNHIYQKNDYSKLIHGESENNIAETRFEACRIEVYNGKYVIYVFGMESNFSEPINYCPFCGKEFNKK